MKYPIRYRNRPDGTHAVLIDFPEFVAVGKNKDEAKAIATELVLNALQLLVDAREPIPEPTRPLKRTWDEVEVEINAQFKLALYKRMLDLEWTGRFLATQLGIERKKQTAYLYRLFNLRFQTRLEQMVAVSRALGLKLMIVVDENHHFQVTDYGP